MGASACALEGVNTYGPELNRASDKEHLVSNYPKLAPKRIRKWWAAMYKACGEHQLRSAKERRQNPERRLGPRKAKQRLS